MRSLLEYDSTIDSQSDFSAEILINRLIIVIIIIVVS
jgi:hypothetical protein